MERKLHPSRVGVLTVSLVVGLDVAAAHADTRPVGGNSSICDKACAKSGSCMPAGDLGHGNKGYIATNGDGSGTVVYCNRKKCVGQDEPAPTREAPKPPKTILDALTHFASHAQQPPASKNKCKVFDSIACEM